MIPRPPPSAQCRRDDIIIVQIAPVADFVGTCSRDDLLPAAVRHHHPHIARRKIVKDERVETRLQGFLAKLRIARSHGYSEIRGPPCDSHKNLPRVSKEGCSARKVSYRDLILNTAMPIRSTERIVAIRILEQGMVQEEALCFLAVGGKHGLFARGTILEGLDE